MVVVTIHCLYVNTSNQNFVEVAEGVGDGYTLKKSNNIIKYMYVGVCWVTGGLCEVIRSRVTGRGGVM